MQLDLCARDQWQADIGRPLADLSQPSNVCFAAVAVRLTLYQNLVPFGNRTTGMIRLREGARSTCREEEQVH